MIDHVIPVDVNKVALALCYDREVPLLVIVELMSWHGLELLSVDSVK